MTALNNDENGRSREELILSYHPLVRTIACRMARRLPPSVDVDELINVGMIGLIDAVDRFDPERGVPFKSYAEIRVQGAMIDALRHDDWVPRSVRRKSNRLDEARTRLSRRLGRDPSREEMATALETTVEQYENLVRDARITRLISLDVSTTDDGRTPLVESISRNDANAEDQMGSEQLKELITYAVNCLPEKERVAVTKYYLQGLTLRQIGAILGVTESRACQLRGQGIKRLKFRLRHAVH
ncbi:MAG: RNA polymerase sigma factor for flagellar operon FliA [Myxococcota bacterium]|jgi:RNA polymerase sigma factor for flagellar operon FliA